MFFPLCVFQRIFHDSLSHTVRQVIMCFLGYLSRSLATLAQQSERFLYIFVRTSKRLIVILYLSLGWVTKLGRGKQASSFMIEEDCCTGLYGLSRKNDLPK